MQDQNPPDGTVACCGMKLDRRSALLMLGAAASGVAVPALAQDDPAAMRPQPGDVLVAASGDLKTPLTSADVKLDTAATEAWPMDPATGTVRNGSSYNRVILFHFAPEELSAESQPKAADGVVAYTIICTHAACEVTDWIADLKIIECPCHLSRYDPKNNAAVVQGPTTRRLPALPLKAEDGKLVVAAVFDSRVGGDSDA